MRSMLDIFLGIYCLGKSQLSIVSLKLLIIIGTHKDICHQENSLRMLLISTIKS